MPALGFLGACVVAYATAKGDAMFVGAAVSCAWLLFGLLRWKGVL